MNTTSDSAHNRTAERVNCRSVGRIAIRHGDPLIDIRVVDVSTGGCKFKIDNLPEADKLSTILPATFDLAAQGSFIEGIVIWCANGMFGCRYYEHVGLDEVAKIMRGGIKITLTNAFVPQA